jgi:signal transduction histidine kinase
MGKETERLHALIQEQLALAEAPELRLVPEDVNRLLRECAEIVEHELKERRVRATVRLGSSLPPLLLDTDLMRRVLLNMLRAGIGHARPGGRIKVQSKRRGERVEVLVAADGSRDVGLVLDNLWSPFRGEVEERASVSSASIQQILRDHRGVLRVSSSPDWPLVFSLILPIVDNRDRRQGAPDRRSGYRRRRA